MANQLTVDTIQDCILRRHVARVRPARKWASTVPAPVNPSSESATPPLPKTSTDTTASSPSSDSGAPRDAYNLVT